MTELNKDNTNTERWNSRLLQSPHCAANCLPTRSLRWSAQGPAVWKWRAAHWALIMYNMSCATRYEGTAQLMFDKLNCKEARNKVAERKQVGHNITKQLTAGYCLQRKNTT